MADQLHTLTASCWCEPASAVDGHVNEDGSQPGRPDLDDTSRCPLDRCCSTCAAEEDDRDLVIGTASTPVGVFCFTLCGPCAKEGFVPRVSYPFAAGAVAEHCGHLGCDLDEAAAVLERERAAVAR